jgi:hypothetical protein
MTHNQSYTTVCYGEMDGVVNPVDRCVTSKFIICNRAGCSVTI